MSCTLNGTSPNPSALIAAGVANAPGARLTGAKEVLKTAIVDLPGRSHGANPTGRDHDIAGRRVHGRHLRHSRLAGHRPEVGQTCPLIRDPKGARGAVRDAHGFTRLVSVIVAPTAERSETRSVCT